MKAALESPPLSSSSCTICIWCGMNPTHMLSFYPSFLLCILFIYLFIYLFIGSFYILCTILRTITHALTYLCILPELLPQNQYNSAPQVTCDLFLVPHRQKKKTKKNNTIDIASMQ